MQHENQIHASMTLRFNVETQFGKKTPSNMLPLFTLIKWAQLRANPVKGYKIHC